jgi:ketosteroid isomerase-like protein
VTDVNRSGGTRNTQGVDAVLDAFHAAAAVADEERYFTCLAPDAVFLGTDTGERWAGTEFREFVHSLFSEGKGWTYLPSDRSVSIANDGRTAWFDERLENDFYGECRGTGLLRLQGDGWRIEQYSLSIPIPDELAPEFVAQIRELR